MRKVFAGGSGDLGKDPVKCAETRRHLKIISEAVYKGWELPDEVSRTLPANLQSIVDDPLSSTRDRIRALECLAALRKDRIEAAVQLDRIQRLDAGSATDRVEVAQIMSDDALAAVARVLALNTEPPECLPKPKRKPRK